MKEDDRPHRGRPRLGEDRKFIKFGISLPPDMFDRLVKYCEDDEREKSWAIKKALDIWLKDKGY